jgi:hypothetical protein
MVYNSTATDYATPAYNVTFLSGMLVQANIW